MLRPCCHSGSGDTARSSYGRLCAARDLVTRPTRDGDLTRGDFSVLGTGHGARGRYLVLKGGVWAQRHAATVLTQA